VKHLASLLALSLAPAYGHAEIRYDYLEFGYERVTIEGLDSANTDFQLRFDDVTDHGLGFEGSYSFGTNTFVFADFSVAEFDLGNDVVSFLQEFDFNADPNVTLSTQALGIGYHTLGSRQLVLKVASLRQEIGSNFLKEATFGYEVGLGFRMMIRHNIEWEAGITYVDPDFNEGATGQFAGSTDLRYYLSQQLAAGLTATNKHHATRIGLDIRYQF